jgi:general stress protein YciG
MIRTFFKRTMSTSSTNPANFANLPKDEVRALASKGGKVAQERRHSAAAADLPGHGNPGNFANRPKEEVREIAAMGGHASGGFANMDPERHVRRSIPVSPLSSGEGGLVGASRLTGFCAM